MAFSGVPMMIGGGLAKHDERLMRQLVADFFYGTEGVARDSDLAVRAQPAPDGTVRMGPGGVAVLNRALGANGREMYYDYNDADITIPIEGTGSSGGRNDLVIVKIMDPYAAGSQYQVPADPSVGPYIAADVIPNVDKRIYNVQQLTDKVRTALASAMVIQPANNKTIQPGMIRDLRSLANGPQRYMEPDPPPDPPAPIVDENPWSDSRIQVVTQTLPYTQNAFMDWPTAANWRVPIPKWANGVDIFFVVENPQQWDHHIWGETRVGIGAHWGTPEPFDMDAIPVPSNWPGCKPSPFFTGISTRPNRIPIFYSTTLAFVGDYKNYPGTVQTVKAQARMYNDANTRGKLVADAGGTVVYMQLNFKTKPIIN